MKDPRYYVAQAADCRRLSLIAPDRLTASRLNELAREYEALVTDLARSGTPILAATLSLDAIAR
jgi:hypothetical protein